MIFPGLPSIRSLVKLSVRMTATSAAPSLNALFMAPDPLGSSCHSRSRPCSLKGCSSTTFNQGKLKCSGTPMILILSIDKDKEAKRVRQTFCTDLLLTQVAPKGIRTEKHLNSRILMQVFLSLALMTGLRSVGKECQPII